MKKTAFTILRVLITAILLYIIFRNLNFAQLKSSLYSLKLIPYAIAVLLIIGNTFLLTERVHVLFSVFKNRPSYFKTLKYYLIGLFFNQTLPTSIGGDSIKGYFLGKDVGDIAGGIIITFIDRVIGVITMLFYLFIAILIGGYRILQGKEFFYLLAIVILIIISVILLFSHRFSRFFYSLTFKKVEHKFKFLHQVKEAYKFFLSTKKEKKIYMLSFINSIFAQILLVVAVYFVSISLGINIHLLDYFIIMPIIFIVSMIPISIGGFGVREGVFVYILGRYGVSSEKALSLSLLFIIIFIVISIIGGVSYLTLHKEKGAINGK
ncbi:flippase-like domain-containing protein [bacterium]|nr:flippase-like domain-containing protein [bacterium]